MSDLQCAATVLVVRHGEAGYDDPHVLSDAGGWLTPSGMAQMDDLAASLAGRNVAAVYASPLARAEQSGRRLADVLGVPWRTLHGVEEFSVGALAGAAHDDPRMLSVFDAWRDGDLTPGLPGAGSGHDVVSACRDALDAVADQHRGETVVVVSHGGVMSLVLPRLAFDAPDDVARGRPVPNAGVVELLADSDGWSLRSWPA